MTGYVITDSSFLLASIDSRDALHRDAVFMFKALLDRKEDLKIIVPPLVIYEVIVVLRRKGVSPDKLDSIILRLVNLSCVSVLSLSELSALKHAKSALNTSDINKALRTQDFLIFCTAEEFQAVFITYDKTMWSRCKTIYPSTYYTSNKGNMTDEWLECLQDIDTRCGKDISQIDYLPF